MIMTGGGEGVHFPSIRGSAKVVIRVFSPFFSVWPARLGHG